MNKENEINILDELSKGASMGMDAIKFILDKVENEEFKKSLELQYNKYNDILEKIEQVYPGEKEPHKTNTINKIMTWYGIEMKTFTNQSNSKIAELLLQGTNMGIIEGRKILNNKEITDNKIKNIVSEYVTMQEDSVENLKKYL